MNVQCQYIDIRDDPAGSVTMPQNGILSQTVRNRELPLAEPRGCGIRMMRYVSSGPATVLLVTVVSLQAAMWAGG